MQLKDLKRLTRGLVPKALLSKVSNELLELSINEMARDINSRLKLLKQNSKFTVTADTYRYDLSDPAVTVTRFLKIDEMGLWWNAGSASSTDWRRMRPKTVKWFDNNFVQWRDQGSQDPLYQAKDGTDLVIYPTPDTTLAEGFWLYFIENTRYMTDPNHYPFGYTSEIPEYSTLHKVIARGAKSYILEMVAEESVATKAFNQYLVMLERESALLGESLVLNYDYEVKMKIKHVC